MKLLNPVTLFMICLGGLMVGIVLWMEPARSPQPLQSLASMQAADAPLPMPDDGRPSHGLHLLSPWQLAAIPTAPRFDLPLGSAAGALTYEVEPSDLQGVVLDGIGGGKADLGDPVFASADGLVVYAGEPSPEQGATVVLAHRTTDGRLLQTSYARLSRIDVAHGSLVARGQVIGRVGTADGRHTAQLVFGAWESDGVSRSSVGRLDPTATIEALRGAPADRPAPSMLSAALEKESAWNQLEIENAGRLGEILAE